MIEQVNRVSVQVNSDFDRVRTGQLKPGLIRLLSPAEGEISQAMQRAPWPGQDIAKQENLDHAREENLNHEKQFSANDRSIPLPVVFAWEPIDGEGEPVQYDLVIARDSHLLEKVVALRGLNEPRAEVYNLCIGTAYFWKVTAEKVIRKGNPEQGESRIGHFRTNPAPPRWINVPGITNVRDIGGWPLPGGPRVRQGMIFRGSEMNDHCVIDPMGRNVMLSDLGIRTDIDLRGLGENRKAVLDARQVVYVNIPILAYDSIAKPQLTRHYRSLFNLFATSSVYPIFLHCWGGADRTGTVVFLILALLGVKSEDLFTEYELTSLSIWGERSRGSEAFQDLLQILELFAPQGSSIQVQVERYLKVIGVTEEEIERIKGLLIEV